LLIKSLKDTSLLLTCPNVMLNPPRPWLTRSPAYPMKYTTCKNDKAVAWSNSFEGALDNHNIYLEAQILKTSDENLNTLKYYSGVSREKRSNAFLHDFI
jgi:hypothetical protein